MVSRGKITEPAIAVLNRRTVTSIAIATGLCAGLLPARGAEQRRTIALLFDSLVSPFWVASIDAMRREAARRSWHVLEAVSNMDDAKQYTQVQSMLQRKVDGIIIVHTDDKAVIPAIRAANAAAVPMVHFNRAPAPNNAYSVAVVADNRSLMEKTVSALIEFPREPGQRFKAAILLGDLGDANGVNRRDGFNDAIARNSNVVDVVARIATDWNADKAFAGLTNALQAHPDINMLVTSSDFMTPQIEQALRSAGKWHRAGEPGHVFIAGFDGDPNGYRKIRDGYFDVDGVQNLNLEVQLAFDALVKMWSGQHPDKIQVDPGFVISRANLPHSRNSVWGYTASNADTPTTAVGQSGSATNSLFPPSGTWKFTVLVTAILAFGRLMFSWDSLHNIILAMLPLTILTAGQMLVMITGQIDLSMTAVLALCSIVSASTMTGYVSSLGEPWTTAAGIGVSLLLGFTVGIFNGFCTARLRLTSFIVTLAVMIMGSGAAVWYASLVSRTISIGGLPHAFINLGYDGVLGIPFAFLLTAALLSILAYGLNRTLIGRWIYAVGRNREAARISGVPVQAITVGVFAFSGLCAALASVIYSARIESGSPTLGATMLLDIVGAAVIGGVSLAGGRGSVAMVIGGVAFLSALDKALQLMGLSYFLVLAIKGATILIAAVIDIGRQSRSNKPLYERLVRDEA